MVPGGDVARRTIKYVWYIIDTMLNFVKVQLQLPFLARDICVGLSLYLNY